MKSFLLILMASFAFPTCSHRAQDNRVVVNGLNTKGNQESHSAAVQFDRGTAFLNDANKKSLRDLATKALSTGKKIDEIKILAWADRESTGEMNRSKTRDVVLAHDRAIVIRKFMKEDLNSNELFDIFNMAKRPGRMDELLKDEEFQMKKEVAESGVSATRLPSGETSYTKAGKVIVIIDYQELTQ